MAGVIYHKRSDVPWAKPNRSAKDREELVHRLMSVSGVTRAMAEDAVDRLEETRVRLERRAREARMEASCDDPDAF